MKMERLDEEEEEHEVQEERLIDATGQSYHQIENTSTSMIIK